MRIHGHTRLPTPYFWPTRPRKVCPDVWDQRSKVRQMRRDRDLPALQRPRLWQVRRDPHRGRRMGRHWRQRQLRQLPWHREDEVVFPAPCNPHSPVPATTTSRGRALSFYGIIFTAGLAGGQRCPRKSKVSSTGCSTRLAQVAGTAVTGSKFSTGANRSFVSFKRETSTPQHERISPHALQAALAPPDVP